MQSNLWPSIQFLSRKVAPVLLRQRMWILAALALCLLLATLDANAGKSAALWLCVAMWLLAFACSATALIYLAGKIASLANVHLLVLELLSRRLRHYLFHLLCSYLLPVRSLVREYLVPPPLAPSYAPSR
ncbi:MAG TPA: hypothetical protein PLW86_05115 [Rhodocyclaceae bacterium]|nr:hypothetical protein [Rhodocyclaceae bacterium]